MLLVIFNLIQKYFGINILGGEFVWLIISPGIVGWIYRNKYKQAITEDVAKKAAKYFVSLILFVGMIAVLIYVARSWSPIYSEQITVLVVALIIYFSILWFLGRWVVFLGLTNYGRNAKNEYADLRNDKKSNFDNRG